MIRVLIIFYLFFSILSCDDEKGKVVKVDVKENHLNKSFKYLDDNWKIVINHEDFQNHLNEYGFIKDNISSYTDSLSVIMVAEYQGDWTKARQATFQIGYTWTRLGYHLWLNTSELKELTRELQLHHPYEVIQFFRAETNNNHPNVKKLFEELKVKLSVDYDIELQSLKSNSDILNFAMRNNPNRLKDFQITQFIITHGYPPGDDFVFGQGCGKENCCQLKNTD